MTTVASVGKDAACILSLPFCRTQSLSFFSLLAVAVPDSTLAHVINTAHSRSFSGGYSLTVGEKELQERAEIAARRCIQIQRPNQQMHATGHSKIYLFCVSVCSLIDFFFFATTKQSPRHPRENRNRYPQTDTTAADNKVCHPAFAQSKMNNSYVSRVQMKFPILSLFQYRCYLWALARHLLWADIDWRKTKRMGGGEGCVCLWGGRGGGVAGGLWQPSTVHFPIPLTEC